jgi:hypothetical protein
MKMMHLITFFLILFFLCSPVYATEQNETSSENLQDLTPITLEVLIYNIDINARKAAVEIKVTLGPVFLTSNTTTIYILNAHEATPIICTRRGTNPQEPSYNNFEGKSNSTMWPFYGMGELFPFEGYRLFFYVFSRDVKNLTLGNYSVRIIGDQLLNEWSADKSGYVKTERIGETFFAALIERNSWKFLFTIILPVVFCFYFLMTSLLLPNNERLKTCYLPLFIFTPTFLIAIQPFLPPRSLLSLPEALLTNLLSGLFIFGIFTILVQPERRKWIDPVLDLFATFILALILPYLFLTLPYRYNFFSINPFVGIFYLSVMSLGAFLANYKLQKCKEDFGKQEGTEKRKEEIRRLKKKIQNIRKIEVCIGVAGCIIILILTFSGEELLWPWWHFLVFASVSISLMGIFALLFSKTLTKWIKILFSLTTFTLGSLLILNPSPIYALLFGISFSSYLYLSSFRPKGPFA